MLSSWHLLNESTQTRTYQARATLCIYQSREQLFPCSFSPLTVLSPGKFFQHASKPSFLESSNCFSIIYLDVRSNQDPLKNLTHDGFKFIIHDNPVPDLHAILEIIRTLQKLHHGAAFQIRKLLRRSTIYKTTVQGLAAFSEFLARKSPGASCLETEWANFLCINSMKYPDGRCRQSPPKTSPTGLFLLGSSALMG